MDTATCVAARAGHPASRAQSNARWKVTSRPCRAPAPAAQRTPWAAGSRFAPLRALTLGLAHSRPRVQRSAGTPCQGSPRSRARASARRRRGRAARPRGAHPAAAEGHQRGQARRVHLAVRREQPQRDARRAQRGRGHDVGGHHLRARRRFRVHCKQAAPFAAHARAARAGALLAAPQAGSPQAPGARRAGRRTWRSAALYRKSPPRGRTSTCSGTSGRTAARTAWIRPARPPRVPQIAPAGPARCGRGAPARARTPRRRARR